MDLFAILAVSADTVGNASKKERSMTAPRTYVTEGELNSVSSYMRGRLTLDKVSIAAA